jgi:two-component system, NarL family, nitrate/nitrite response regulator NarP
MTGGMHAAADTVARAPIRVSVADDRRLVADALAALIRTMDGFELVDVFDGAAELPAIVARDPGVLLVATGADPTGGFKLVRELREIGLRAEIVLLADVLSPELVRFTLDQRLSGLILTDTPASGLAACLGRVASGHAVLPADWQAVLATQSHDPVGSLSDRQLEVLRLVAEGYSYEEIGRRLFISANTVKFHLRAIYMRLGVRNRVAAARMLSERRSPEGNPAHKVGPGPRSEIRPEEDEPPRAE